MADSENDRISRAANLAMWLRSALLEVQVPQSQVDSEFNRLGEPLGDGEWRPLPDQSRWEQMTSFQPFGEIVDTLEQILVDAGYKPQTSKPLLAPDEFWTLGSVTFAFPIRAIHHGFVEPVLRVPIVPDVPEIVVAYLMEIPGERDLLKREHHNQVGWHYHYLDFKKVRSNVVLCWDTRAVRQSDKDHPLFQEPHGESLAGFTARPDLWGATKKKSMHNTCAPDLDTWPLNTFRCASGKAGPVWPLSAKLTPITKAAPPAPKFTAQKGGKGRR